MRQGITLKNLINILFCAYILLLPFEEAIAFHGVTALRVVSLALIGLCLIASKGTISFKDFLLPLFIWMLFSLCSFLWAESFEESWRFYRIYLIQFVMIIMLFSLPKGFISMKSTATSFIVSGFISSFLIFVLPTSTITKEGRRTVALFGTALDPNLVGGIIIIAILFALLFFFDENRKRKILYLFIVGFELFGMLLTGSRGSLLSLAIGLLALLLLKRKNLLKNIKTFNVSVQMQPTEL